MCKKKSLHEAIISNTVKIAVALNRLPITNLERAEIEKYLGDIENAIHEYCCSKKEKTQLAEQLGLKKKRAFDYMIGKDIMQCVCR